MSALVRFNFDSAMKWLSKDEGSRAIDRLPGGSRYRCCRARWQVSARRRGHDTSRVLWSYPTPVSTVDGTWHPVATEPNPGGEGNDAVQWQSHIKCCIGIGYLSKDKDRELGRESLSQLNLFSRIPNPWCYMTVQVVIHSTTTEKDKSIFTS